MWMPGQDARGGQDRWDNWYGWMGEGQDECGGHLGEGGGSMGYAGAGKRRETPDSAGRSYSLYSAGFCRILPATKNTKNTKNAGGLLFFVIGNAFFVFLVTYSLYSL